MDNSGGIQRFQRQQNNKTAEFIIGIHKVMRRAERSWVVTGRDRVAKAP